jgi:hypothetical protein
MKEMTKKLIYPLFALMVAVCMTMVAAAQGSTTIKGAYLVDVACGTSKVHDGAGAEAHSGKKGCATKEACSKSGLGFFHDGKFHKFDAKGSDLAKAALAKSAKDTGAKFTVVGKAEGGVFHATAITEEE